MGSLSADLESRLVPGTLCACATILTYDLLCTLDQEVRYVWPRPWTTSTLLFFLNRYLPFLDTFLSLTARFSHLSPEQCFQRNMAVGWLSFFGVMLSELILILRTCAIWERNRFVLIFLCTLSLGSWIPMGVLLYLETKTLDYQAVPNGGVGCYLVDAGHVLLYGYLLVMISETAVAILTAVKAYKDLRRSRVPWVVKLYQDGLLFYFYALAISIANVLVPILAPSMFANWLSTPQRVVHSLLSTRVLLLIMRRRQIVSSSARESSSSLESPASRLQTGIVFSSFVEETPDIALSTFESRSSSPRDPCLYPSSTDSEYYKDI